MSLDETVLKVLRAKSVLHYMCAKCSPTPLKGRLVVEKDGQSVTQESLEFKEMLKNRDEKIEKMAKEIDRIKQRNTQLNSQLVQHSEEPSTNPSNQEDLKVIAILKKQVETTTLRNDQLSNMLAKIEEEKLIKNVPTESEKDLAIRERDETIATLNKQADALNTQITLLLNNTTATLTNAKRPRTIETAPDSNRLPDPNNLNDPVTIMDIDDKESLHKP